MSIKMVRVKIWSELLYIGEDGVEIITRINKGLYQLKEEHKQEVKSFLKGVIDALEKRK